MSYSSVVLADSPVGYWRLGESSGNFADSSVSAHTATVTGSTITYSQTSLIASDAANTAVLFNGATADAGNSNFTTLPFTIEVWVKLVSQKSPGSFVTCGQAGSTGWRVGQSGTNYFMTAFGVADVTFTTALAVGVTTHTVWVFKTDHTVDLYVNGAFAENKSLGTIGSFGSPMHIGTTNGAADPCNAVLDEVAIYTVALNSTQIAAHYAAAGVAALPTQNFPRTTLAVTRAATR